MCVACTVTDACLLRSRERFHRDAGTDAWHVPGIMQTFHIRRWFLAAALIGARTSSAISRSETTRGLRDGAAVLQATAAGFFLACSSNARGRWGQSEKARRPFAEQTKWVARPSTQPCTIGWVQRAGAGSRAGTTLIACPPLISFI
jgi:hypothetical protein